MFVEQYNNYYYLNQTWWWVRSRVYLWKINKVEDSHIQALYKDIYTKILDSGIYITFYNTLKSRDQKKLNCILLYPEKTLSL